jgi:hypothetical protein
MAENICRTLGEALRLRDLNNPTEAVGSPGPSLKALCHGNQLADPLDSNLVISVAKVSRPFEKGRADRDTLRIRKTPY